MRASSYLNHPKNAFYVPIAIGTNYERGHNSTKIGSVHAEHSAIMKLRPLKKSNHNKKCKRVDIVVVRVNGRGEFGASKPCSHCVRDIHNLLPRRGYVADNVYYSTETGDIVQTRATRLLFDDTVRPSCYYVNHNAHRITRKLDKLRREKWTPYATSSSDNDSDSDSNSSTTTSETITNEIVPMMSHEARMKRRREYQRRKKYHVYSR